jgi:hypothetical protein
MNQEWFEMLDIRKRFYDTAVWVPLRAAFDILSEGEYGYIGYKREFFGAGSLAVPLKNKSDTEKLGWMEVGISHDHGSYVDNGKYHQSDIFEDDKGTFTGIHLLLAQRGNSDEHSIWHLHQDIVIALGLKREDDVWVSPDEGYVDVAHLRRREDGSPCLLEIRAEHLKDYLCARDMALYLTSYRTRMIVVDNPSFIKWTDNPISQISKGDRWEGRVIEIHEGGSAYGAKTAIFHASRTDVDPEEDVPTFDFPANENIVSTSWTVEDKGRKLYIIEGELWRNEWVNPSTLSHRIRGDKSPATVYFITDSSGTREDAETLDKHGRWLWFKPDVIMALAHRRGGSLEWYTCDTGGVKCSPDYNIHFGINQLGLINVYAKDISLLPEWQQKIWAGYNVGPDGKVSEELLASQMRAIPARTHAPEPFLSKGIDLANEVTLAKFNFRLFREHEHKSQLLKICHRFRSIDLSGFLSLAKDLARLTADSINTDSLQTIVKPPEGKKWGSLKSLENVLAKYIEPQEARSLLSPLVGIYELRLADAHLPSNTLKESYTLAKVDDTKPFIFQGFMILHMCVSSIYGIAEVLKEVNPDLKKTCI